MRRTRRTKRPDRPRSGGGCRCLAQAARSHQGRHPGDGDGGTAGRCGGLTDDRNDRRRCRRSGIGADAFRGFGWLSRTVQSNPVAITANGDHGRGHRKSNQTGPAGRGPHVDYPSVTTQEIERQNRQRATSDCLVARERTTGVASSEFCSVGSNESWAMSLLPASGFRNCPT